MSAHAEVKQPDREADHFYLDVQFVHSSLQTSTIVTARQIRLFYREAPLLILISG